MSLTTSQRKFLRGLAHHLNPVVGVGKGGASDAVVAELDRALNAHELVKVQVQGDDREAREAVYATLCEATGAEPVQHLGKVLILYRPAPEPRITLPR